MRMLKGWQLFALMNIFIGINYYYPNRPARICAGLCAVILASQVLRFLIVKFAAKPEIESPIDIHIKSMHEHLTKIKITRDRMKLDSDYMEQQALKSKSSLSSNKIYQKNESNIKKENAKLDRVQMNINWLEEKKKNI